MKISTFNPMIMSPNAEELISLFEDLSRLFDKPLTESQKDGMIVFASESKSGCGGIHDH